MLSELANNELEPPLAHVSRSVEHEPFCLLLYLSFLNKVHENNLIANISSL